MKREHSFPQTIVGNDDDIGDCSQSVDPDFIEISSTDLRAMRKDMRKHQLPSEDSEVIVLD